MPRLSPAAAAAEQGMSERMRRTWRVWAVDDDIAAVTGRKVLVAGKNLRNIGIELKSVLAGPLDLNNRQYDVLRRTRDDIPPFVAQFTSPPQQPWGFRIFALRHDSLEALGGHAYVTLTERQAEAFVFTLCSGRNFPFTEVHTAMPFRHTSRTNQYPGSCVACGARVPEGQGLLLEQSDGRRWTTIHQGCSRAEMTIPTVEVTLAGGAAAMYLAEFDDTPIPDDVWPKVVPPRTYQDAPRKPAFVIQAARYLDVVGALDRAPFATPRPDLSIVPQPVPAESLVERALRVGKRQPPTDRQIQKAVEDYELQATGHILRSAWVDNASLGQLETWAQRVVKMGIAGPFGGSKGSGPGVDIAEWDWPGIRANERAAREKIRRMPRCGECGQSMVLGQTVHHFVCKRTG